MTTRIYRSIDGGAPSLTGAAGSGINLLDTVLINGYNSKTITITRSGSTATATCSSHGFPNDGVTRITISGAGQSEYNIETYITNVTTNTFDFTVTGSPATPATGTINAIVTPAGWAKGYTGTNLATYKNSVSQAGSLHTRQLRVDDTNTTHMIVCGYESMTGVSTGLMPMPVVASQSATGGSHWVKATAGATARPWTIIASEKFIVLYTDAGATSWYTPSVNSAMYVYGDYTPFFSTDLYNTIIIAGTGLTSTTSNYMYAIAAPILATAYNGHFIQRGIYGNGSSKNFMKASMLGASNASVSMGAGYCPAVWPDNYFNFGYTYIQENAPDGAIIRGKLPGIRDPLSVYTTWTHGDIIVPQSGTATGRKFIFLKCQNSATNTCTAGNIVDFSDNWDS